VEKGGSDWLRGDIHPGDAFAYGFDKDGFYGNARSGNHAILIVKVHRDERGKVVSVDYAEQWVNRSGRPEQPIRIIENVPVDQLKGLGCFSISKGR
jgi:hypothetical protein